MDERDNINLYREKKIRRKNIIRLVILAVIAAAIIVFALNWRTILKPLKDIAADQGSFPIDVMGSANYISGGMGENIYLLTDTYLYIYNDSGAKLCNKQHGFQNPVCSVNDKRALIFDKNGKDIKVYSKNTELFSKSFEDTIVFAQMGTDERSAIVTTSTRYSNFLYVLNGEGKQIFRWSSPDEKIMQVCFGSGDKNIFVSVVGEKDGALKSSVLCFDVGNTDSEKWRVPIGSNVSYSLEYDSGGIYAVTPTGAFLIDEKTGNIISSNSFTKEISAIPRTDGLHAVVFRDPASNGVQMELFDENLKSLYVFSPEAASSYQIYDSKLYVLSGSKLTAYDAQMQIVGNYALSDEYYDVRIVGKYAYLMGYNRIDQLLL